MKITSYQKMIKNIAAKTLLGAAALFATIGGGLAGSANAAESNNLDAAAHNFASSAMMQETQDENYYYYYFTRKHWAESNLRFQKRVGKDATMYQESARGKWVVKVRKNRGAISSSSSNSSDPEGYGRPGVGRGGQRDSTNVSDGDTRQIATGAGCEQALRNATVLHYPASAKSMAQDMYNAHLKQGDCAKLWFDSSRNEWALAIKAVPAARSRRGAVKVNRQRRPL